MKTIEDKEDMYAVKTKLSHLEKYFPEQEKVVYDFGRLFAKKIKPESDISSSEFYVMGLSTLIEMKENPRYGSGIKKIAAYIPDIAHAICSEYFSDEIKREYKIMEETGIFED